MICVVVVIILNYIPGIFIILGLLNGGLTGKATGGKQELRYDLERAQQLLGTKEREICEVLLPLE